MPKAVIKEAGILLPNIPDSITSFNQVRDILNDLRRSINDLLYQSKSSGILIGDNKIGFVDSVHEDLVD